MSVKNIKTIQDLVKYFPEYISHENVLKELLEYKKDLEVLANAEVSIQFNNKGREHAIFVMSEIFDTAYRNIRVFASNFKGDISDNDMYLESLQDFLERSSENKVEVIFENEPNSESKALALLRKKKTTSPNQVDLKRVHPEQLKKFRSYIVNDEGMIHFTMGDDASKGFNKYRCETDTKNFIAILNFDDPKFCNTLNKMYDILNVNTISIS